MPPVLHISALKIDSPLLLKIPEMKVGTRPPVPPICKFETTLLFRHIKYHHLMTAI